LEQENIAEWEHQCTLPKAQWYIVEMTPAGNSVLEQIYIAVLVQIGILFLEQWQEQLYISVMELGRTFVN